MSDRTPSRLEGARRRTAETKRALAIVSVAAFGIAAVWAHASHPGSPAVPSGGTGGVTLDDDAGFDSDSDSDFDFGSGSLSPSTGSAPDTGTHVS